MGRTGTALILSGFLAAGLACGESTTDPPIERPPVFPTIERFDISSPTVAPGQTVRLSYRVKNATFVSITPNLIAGTAQLEDTVDTPPITETTTFTLTAASEVGETSRSVVVTVVAGEVMIESFLATEPVIAPGSSTNLQWTTRAATRVSLAVQGGEVLVERADAVGQLSVSPSTNTTYVLTVEGLGGPKSAQLLVLVGLEPRVISFVADPPQITLGGTGSTLRWDAVNASAITIRDGRGQVVVANAPLSGTQAVNPTVDTTYMLVASSPVGSAAAMASIAVLPAGSARILEFTANPTVLAGPGDTVITWNTADADTVDLLANGTTVTTFPRTAAGTMNLRLDSTSDLELVAENGAGTTRAMVMVTVGTPDTTGPIIQHNALANGQPENAALDVVATITDDASAIGTATLFYRTVGDVNYQSLTLLAQGNDRYLAQIPAVAVRSPGIEYYLLATDNAPSTNASTSPLGAPANVFTFTVLPADTAGPTVMHTRVPDDRQEGTAISISAMATDASGVASVFLYYKRQTDSLYTRLTLTQAGAEWSGTIPATEIVPPGLDYYLEASDIRTPANVTRDPGNAPTSVYSFRVLALDLTPPAVTHMPIANGQAGNVAVTISADVTDPSGVGMVQLFYKHRSQSNYTAVAMTGGGDTKVAQIPASAVQEPGVDYYFQVTDQAAPPNVGRVPVTAPGTPYAFSVTPVDMAAPSIQHTVLADGQPAGVARPISAVVADGSGVSQVTLHYRTTGSGSYTALAMAGGPTYVATIPANGVAAPGVEYYFEAVDSSPNANRALLPAAAPAMVYSFRTGVAEVEPNNTSAQATPFLSAAATPLIGLGAIGTATDRDFYTIDVPTGARLNLRAEVTIGGVGLCPTSDPRLFLYASDGTTVLVNDDQDGVSNCPLIDAATDSGARDLAPGRYYLAVEESGQNAIIAAYELRVLLTPIACGNGLLERSSEQCEDGNTMSGDGCSPTCQIEADGTFTGTGGSLTGAISPAGDSDYFAVTVTAGQYLSAATSDGATGCPGDTILELYGTDAVTLLGSDDDDGNGSCSDINPVRDLFVRALPAGTYYLRVRGYNATTTINAYTLTVVIADSICGNGTIEGPEQCDDGDTNSNDGCSAACQWETAGTITGAGATINGALTPAGNIDWYQVTVPAGYALRAEVNAPTAGLCTNTDTVLRLWAANRTTAIYSDDDSGVDRCSLMNPAVDPEVRGLAAGTYYLSVEEYGNDLAVAAYVLSVVIEAPRCGDGYASGTETCDDGNMVANDGCSATCTFEGTAETEPNDTRPTATVLLAAGQTSGAILGGLSVATDSDYYSVVVPAGSHIVAEVTSPNGGCPFDLDLALYTPAGATRTSDTQDGVGACPRIAPGLDTNARDLPAGTYTLRVTAPGAITSAIYQLSVRLLTPGCGDLFQDATASETCDDGNTTSGDGCSSACTFEQAEVEPNDAFGTATPISGQMIQGNLAAGEFDWFSVVVPQGASLSAATHRGGPDQCAATLESSIDVYGLDGTTVLATDLQDGPGYCSVVYRSELSNLNAGTYFIRVGGFAANDTFDYALSVIVTP